MTFDVYRVESGQNRVVWSGTPDDATAPIAFIPLMREFGPQMRPGDVLRLNAWHFGVLRA